MVQSAMNAKNRNRGKGRGNVQPRASITFPPDLYKTVEDLAKRKKVSIAWVVREAVEEYVANKWPLLAPLKNE
jgi:Ribbon-helix-helix protein, copG family